MPTDPTATQARIDEINAILRAGASSVAIDGLTVSWDFDSLRRERAELEKSLGTTRKRRRIAYRNNLG